MKLEEIQKIHPDLRDALESLRKTLGDEGSRVFSVSAKIQTNVNDKMATWIVVLDGFGNLTVTRT